MQSNAKWTLQVHKATVEAGAYPSPLNYYSFPKSVCTSVNEVSSSLSTIHHDGNTFTVQIALGL